MQLLLPPPRSARRVADEGGSERSLRPSQVRRPTDRPTDRLGPPEVAARAGAGGVMFADVERRRWPWRCSGSDERASERAQVLGAIDQG